MREEMGMFYDEIEAIECGRVRTGDEAAQEDLIKTLQRTFVATCEKLPFYGNAFFHCHRVSHDEEHTLIATGGMH